MDLVHPVDQPASAAAWAEAMSEGKSHDHEQRMRGCGGDYRRFLVRAEPRRDEQRARGPAAGARHSLRFHHRL
ncbi:PAS domain-containing protein [Sphingobium ummariense]|uniref:PAS domain-containing protein n=1 Tax=Sphingobium ummariense TaxID=420994 RepID=UPI0038B61E03